MLVLSYNSYYYRQVNNSGKIVFQIEYVHLSNFLSSVVVIFDYRKKWAFPLPPPTYVLPCDRASIKHGKWSSNKANQGYRDTLYFLFILLNVLDPRET